MRRHLIIGIRGPRSAASTSETSSWSYLKRLLPKRPDLQVIITSATRDPSVSLVWLQQRRLVIEGAPGRFTLSVEVRYRHCLLK